MEDPQDPSTPFRRHADGTFTLGLSEAERDLLEGLTRQLRDLLRSDSTALTRLFPPAYGDDRERNEGYAALAGAELLEGREASLSLVTETLRAERIDEEQLEAWMRSLNDLRLVLGTVLDVTEDTEPDPEDERAPMFAVYEYLGALLHQVVRALSQ